ncbi:lactadherin-like [Porites lutea]|uniref:lactadherin-like n=1 Tax=Porites lutea TaxID=51062 RepID=UPI003CC56902
MQLKPLTWLSFFVFLAVNSNGEEGECFAPAIGMETGAILDSQMTASSEHDFAKVPFARLNANISAWCPTGDIELTEWVQIDLGRLYRVCAVATQGNPGGNKDYLK